MILKTLTLATAAVALLYTPTTFAQAATNTASEEAKKAQADAKELQERLETEITNSPSETTPPATEDPLMTQYKSRKDKNFKTIEFELAKELALHRGASFLNEEEGRLFAGALLNLNTVFGKVSEPQKEETFFEYQEDPDTGAFVVVLVKDSYVKAERGDVCLIGTQVHLRTSVQQEFSAKLASLGTTEPTTPNVIAGATPTEGATVTDVPASTALKAPTNITEIECYNDERPTYSQRLVN